MDRKLLYEFFYAFAARDGREEVLFGDSSACAREAFARGLCGIAFPELWFELPLLGEPWFDLHMLVSREDMHEGVAFAGLDGPYADALGWFADSENTRQLALSFDTGRGEAARPALQLLLRSRSLAAARGFFAAAGRTDASAAYRSFILSLPPRWFACYVGLFPARDAAEWVRVECIVGDEAQRAYAEDVRVLRSQLAQVGLTEVDDAQLARLQELARSPFPLEFQFNVGPDGAALPTLGASLRFRPTHWREGGSDDVLALFRRAQEWGLADERCRLLAQTAFARRVKLADDVARLWCYPAFLKLRWQGAEPVDAKTYLMAGVL